jgi:hypothetical protein
MKPVDRMRKLVNSLPESDITVASMFIDTRDFESLNELVVSAIQKTKNSLRSENLKEEYLNADITDMNTLRAEVDVYLAQLEGLDRVGDNTVDAIFEDNEPELGW